MGKVDLNIGIIGAGKFADRHARAMNRSGCCRLIGAYRSNQTELKKFSERHGVLSYLNYHDLLSDRHIDAVLIATPHHMHTQIAIDAARAGKHILLEKPFAPTVAECSQVIEEVKRNNVKLMIGHTAQFTPAFLKAKEVLNSGKLGSILQVSATSNTYWMGPDRKEWHLYKKTAGGYLLTLAIHQLDVLTSLVGSSVSSVRATVGSLVHNYEIDDSGVIWLNYCNRVTGSLHFFGYKQGVEKVEVEIYCEHGMLKISNREGAFVGTDGTWKMINGSNSTSWLDDALVNEWKGFANAVVSGTRPATDGDYGRHIIEIIEAALNSSMTDKEVQLNSTSIQIT